MSCVRKVAMVGLLLAMSAAGCDKTLPEDEIAAKVNGKPIAKKNFKAALERNMARYQGKGHELPPGIEARIKQSVLRKLVNDEIVRQKAEALGVTIADEEVASRFGQHKKRFRTDKAFEDYLQRSGNTIENMKADLKRNLRRDAVVKQMSGSVEVTDAEVRDYYDKHKDRFRRRAKVKASRILIRVPSSASAAKKRNAKKKAEKIRAQAAAGGDFAKLAEEHSQGPSAGRGGQLHWLPKGRMTQDFDKVAFGLEPGKVSEVFETRLGYEIVKVWDKKPAQDRAFEDVERSIRNSLMARKRNRKRREVLRQLKDEAKVDILLEFDTPKPKRPPRPSRATAAGGKPDANGSAASEKDGEGAEQAPKKPTPAR